MEGLNGVFMQPLAVNTRQEVDDGQHYERHDGRAKHAFPSHDQQRWDRQVRHEVVLESQLRRLHCLPRSLHRFSDCQLP